MTARGTTSYMTRWGLPTTRLMLKSVPPTASASTRSHSCLCTSLESVASSSMHFLVFMTVTAEPRVHGGNGRAACLVVASALQDSMHCARVQVKADAVTEHEAEQQLEHVKEAYEVLSSHKLRQEYDKIGYSGGAMASSYLLPACCNLARLCGQATAVLCCGCTVGCKVLHCDLNVCLLTWFILPSGMHEQQLVSAAQAVGLALAGDYFEEYVGQVPAMFMDMPTLKDVRVPLQHIVDSPAGLAFPRILDNPILGDPEKPSLRLLPAGGNGGSGRHCGRAGLCGA